MNIRGIILTTVWGFCIGCSAQNASQIDVQVGTVPPMYFREIKESNGVLLCDNYGKWGIYNKKFDEIYPCQFQDIKFATISNREYLFGKMNGCWGAYDYVSRKQILNNEFQEIGVIQEIDANLFWVKKNDKEGVYTMNGAVIIPAEYSSVKQTRIFADERSLEAKSQDGTIGLFTLQGFTILPTGKYVSYEFKNDYVEVVNGDGKKGVCSITGQELIPCKYDKLFYDGEIHAFLAQIDDTKGYVSYNGEEMFPFVTYSIEREKDLIYYQDNSNPKGTIYGVLDYDGNYVISGKKKIITHEMADKARKKNKNVSIAFQTKTEMLKAAYDNAIFANEVEKTKRNTFSFFAQNYVERLVHEWQHKGEFEKKDAWQRRVNVDTRRQKIFELTKEAQQIYIDVHSKKLPTDSIAIVGNYDADNETYRIKSKYCNKEMLVHVATEDAQEFKAQFSNLRKRPTFFIENDGLELAEYAFTMSNGKRYKYSNQASLNYSIAQVEYSLDDINIDPSISNVNGKRGRQTISTTTLSIGTSDVDVAIPIAENQQKNTFAVIIANENYSNEKQVEYAYNDGQVFRDYCAKALGIPDDNIHFRANASLNDIRFEVNWIKQTAAAFNGDAKFVVYYAGHGMPDDSTRNAYLLPVDGFSSDLASGYKLSDLYDVLGSIPSQNVMMFLDACFSGSQRNGETIASARGVAIKPNISAPQGNLVVFSATTDKETAYPYREKHHGLFTYYLLKKIKESEGALSLGELSEYVSSEVSKQSIVVNQKSQTPNVNASDNLKDTWKELSIK